MGCRRDRVDAVRADEGQGRTAERQERKGDHDGEGDHACRRTGAAERCRGAEETPDAGSGSGSARAQGQRCGRRTSAGWPY
jgi:hypothetical protein